MLAGFLWVDHTDQRVGMRTGSLISPGSVLGKCPQASLDTAGTSPGFQGPLVAAKTQAEIKKHEAATSEGFPASHVTRLPPYNLPTPQYNCSCYIQCQVSG